MSEDILSASSRNLKEVQAVNKELTQKALYMRCVGYLSRVKEQLLMQTIYEIDNSKKELMKVYRAMQRQSDIISRQKSELEEKNTMLERIQKELEDRVNERTGQLEIVNQELRREIEERKSAEKEKHKYLEQLVQARKMESIGRMAGGIAHDFNNLLTAVLGYGQLALNKLANDDPLTAELNIILDAGERAAALTRQLMAFSRKQTLEVRVVSLNRIVLGMAKMLERMLGTSFDVLVHIEPTLANVKADVCQMEQVLLNLAINARDAMPNGGRLVIETTNVEFKDSVANYPQDLKPGNYVMLAVTDTGEGITPDVLDKIFEPFFTTKKEGKGTGLGLATVHAIVRQHNGHISVYSELERGTTFKIYLPATPQPLAEREVPVFTGMPNGTETILVVDDQPTIRRLVIDTLQFLGYKILEAGCGEEALEIWEKCGEKIDLALIDVIMPGMTGKELRNELLKKSTPSKMILMSGYTDHILSQYGVVTPETAFLQKPFSPSQLATKIRSVLDGKE